MERFHYFISLRQTSLLLSKPIGNHDTGHSKDVSNDRENNPL